MRKFQLFIASVLLLFSSVLFAASASQQLSTLLAQMNNFQADFTQTVQDKYGNILQQSQGKAALQRPGLFHWETLQPNAQLIIADGKTIWIEDKDLQQVTKQSQQSAANTPGLLLSASVGKFISQFKIITDTPYKENFKLMPMNKKELFNTVSLVFDKGLLKQMRLEDNLGQTTQINFTQIKTNSKLSQSLFTFHAEPALREKD